MPFDTLTRAPREMKEDARAALTLSLSPSRITHIYQFAARRTTRSLVVPFELQAYVYKRICIRARVALVARGGGSGGIADTMCVV